MINHTHKYQVSLLLGGYSILENCYILLSYFAYIFRSKVTDKSIRIKNGHICRWRRCYCSWRIHQTYDCKRKVFKLIVWTEGWQKLLDTNATKVEIWKERSCCDTFTKKPIKCNKQINVRMKWKIYIILHAIVTLFSSWPLVSSQDKYHL